jgi:hypothetical protein
MCIISLIGIHAGESFTVATNPHLRLVDSDFDAQLIAERDRLSALYDRRPNLFDAIAENAEEVAARNLWDEVRDVTIWTGVAIFLLGVASWVL